MGYLESFRKYATFSGRAGLREYWMFVLVFQILVAVVLGIVEGITDTKILIGLYILFIALPSLTVTVRRLHDTGKSGMFILVGFVPFIGWLILFYFLVQPSNFRRNQYDIDQTDIEPEIQSIVTNGADLGLVNFIKKSKDAGKTEEEIRAVLLGNNLSEPEINQTMGGLKGHILSDIVDVQSENLEAKKTEKWLIVGVSLLLVAVVAGAVYEFNRNSDERQSSQEMITDISTTLQRQSELKSTNFGSRTINGVDAKFSMFVPDGDDEYCKYVKEGSKAIGASGREYTVCVKTTTRCDIINDLDFDVSTERDRVLLKYNHEPVEYCELSELKFVHLLYTLTNLKDGGVSSEIAVNQPDQRVLEIEAVLNDDGTQLNRDADYLCAFNMAWGASEIEDDKKRKMYESAFNEIVRPYGLTGFEEFIPEWKKVELRLKSDIEYHKKVYAIFEQKCTEENLKLPI
jgi:uncharacterized membrane protein YhaH (DUF805 family)